MSVTVPLGMRHRLIIGHSREAGWWMAKWRRPSHGGWNLGSDDGEDPPDAGVREPRIPPLSPRDGAVSLPEPD